MSSSNILIREVGPREGFQNFKRSIPTREKIELIRLLSDTGIKTIEVTAFVRPDLVPQMADAAEVVRHLPKSPVRYTALYLNPKGFERAEEFPELKNDGWIPAAASEAFLRANNNLTFEDLFALLSMWESTFEKAGKTVHGIMMSTAFGSNTEGPILPEQVLKMLSEIITRLGHRPREICLADTMGWGTPLQVKKCIRLIKNEYPEVVISLHLHDTRGLGIANAFAGLEEGVTVFDSSLGGVGGCPFAKGATGNIATEVLVYLLEREGLKTGVDLKKCVETLKYLESILGEALPSPYFSAIKAVGV